MLVRLIALSNKTMHTIALLYAISFCYRPHWESLQEKRLTTRALCSHAVTRPLLQTYRAYEYNIPRSLRLYHMEK